VTPASALTNAVRLATSRLGARLFPMTVGKFFGPVHRARRITKTETITVNAGDIVIRQGHIVSVGLVGMSDLVGPSPLKITPEHVGQTVAIYTAGEVKYGVDRLRQGQPEFLEMVKKMGGRSGVIRSPEDGVRIVMSEPGS